MTRKRATPKAPAKGAFPSTDLDSLPPPAAKVSRFANIKTDIKRASEVLDAVRAVPTIFPDFNRKTRVGGLPVRRQTTVHGPTHGGKTAFVMGLVRSFIEQDHAAKYIDAEHTLGKEFAVQLVGRLLEASPNFFALRPKNYEDTITEVDEFIKLIAGMRKDDPSIASIVVVDSINKLTPKRELKQLLEDKQHGDNINKGLGRARAGINQSWIDHLTPQLAAADCAMVMIAQERKEADPDPWAKKEDLTKIKGGDALAYEASLRIQVSKGTALYETPGDWKTDTVGFKHVVKIWKSKVGHLDGKFTECIFHMSNGKMTPEGFDTPRDVIMVAKDMGIIACASGSSWLTYGKSRWQGEHRAALALVKNPDIQTELLNAIDKAIAIEIAQGEVK